jgi:pullulanase/glycogen debranching enzyme
VLDVRRAGAKPGRHEFKFVADGAWEPGDNRVLHLNDDLLLERPPDVVLDARLDAPDTIVVYLKRPVADAARVTARLEPPAEIRSVRLASGDGESGLRGYAFAGDALKFVFDEAAYGVAIPATSLVAVAGNFNYWNGGGGPQGQWRLLDADDDGRWELVVPSSGLRKPAAEPDLQFKFVVGGGRWMAPPAGAANRAVDASGNANLRVDPSAGASTLEIRTAAPLDLSAGHTLVLDGLADRRIRRTVSPGRALDRIVSAKPLGALLDRTQAATTYRLFAPRASAVHLCFFDGPEYEVHQPAYRRLEPAERYPMWRDPADGVWELSPAGLDAGRYYAFTVDGPAGDGEGFNGEAFLGDPYALAAAHSQNNTIVIDPAETNAWFGGWSDEGYRPPRHQDMLIYEAHVRDLTAHPSSGVPADLRGTYEGVLATAGTGAGLDHIRDMGFNMIELLPVAEFENGTTNYSWGYNTVYYFSPEASYARAPLAGSQHFEFKRLVNELHRRGFGVILDVVYNHVGGPNIFSLIDRKYFFRLTPDHRFLNFSGVGNDVRTEAPMMRRLIVDNIVHWLREYRVDGFRLDLAELIDMETMMAIRDAALKVNPDVILISEPWSFRGENKAELRGTSWAAWNNDYRYGIKDFVRGRADRGHIQRIVAGSVDTWAASPLQSVNYAESHDDMALADELSQRPDHNGSELHPREADMNRLVAAMLFTSLGIPMINEGQEFARSKLGISNTFDRGDAVNAIRWTDRERPLAADVMRFYRDMVRLRQSAEGEAFRLADAPPAGYVQWILPADGRMLGYVVNTEHVRAGRGFVVLLNAADQAADFSFALPAGRWQIVADGRRAEAAGLPGRTPLDGGSSVTLTVPPVGSLILMDGF